MGCTKRHHVAGVDSGALGCSIKEHGRGLDERAAGSLSATRPRFLAIPVSRRESCSRMGDYECVLMERLVNTLKNHLTFLFVCKLGVN